MRRVLLLALVVLLAAMACDKAAGPESIRYEDTSKYGTLIKEGPNTIAVYEMHASGVIGYPELWDKGLLPDDNPLKAQWCNDACHSWPFDEPRKQKWQDKSYVDYGGE